MGVGDETKLSLGYWHIRGLAAPARMMLHYADIDYNDVSYTSMDSWFKEGKPALIEKNPLINLPWVQYKGEVVTQSNAVLLFIGRVAKLNGSTESEINRNEQILCQTFDLRNKVVDIVYSPTGSEKVDEHFSGMVNTHYTKFENWLKLHNQAFFSAGTPLAADFHVFEMLDQHEGWASTVGKESPLKEYPLLTQFYNRVLELDGLKSYFASDMANLTYNSPVAATFVSKPGNGYGTKIE